MLLGITVNLTISLLAAVVYLSLKSILADIPYIQRYKPYYILMRGRIKEGNWVITKISPSDN